MSAIGKQLLHAAANEQRAKGGQKRGNTQPGDQPGIEQPGQAASQQPTGNRDIEPEAGIEQQDEGQRREVQRSAD
ncbi:hypothetical protein D3C78_1634190 [compost metagenome]